MFRQSVNPTLSTYVLDAAVGALSSTSTGDILLPANLRLFTAVSGTITPSTPKSAFTEATFVGYAGAVLTIGTTPINTPGSLGLAVDSTAQFVAGTGIVPPGENILGYFVDNGGSQILMAELFLVPVPIVNVGDYLALTVLFGFNYSNQMT